MRPSRPASRPARDRRPSTIAVLGGAAIILAGLTQTTLASANPGDGAPTAGSAPADAEPPAADAAPAADASGTETVRHSEDIPAGKLWHEVPKLQCPAGTHLTADTFGPTTWRIPAGLEIQQFNPLFDVDVWSFSADGHAVGVGGFGSTVSNWFGPAQRITYVLHCVR